MGKKSMKKILITGATDGIGKQTALNLAATKNHIIIVGRNEEKCQTVRNQIVNATSNENIDFLVSDLSLISDNKLLASKIKANYSNIDVLINNVGALFAKRKETSEGIEKTFALNHLGVFSLTLDLLEILKQGQSSRIVNVASAAHFNVVDKSKREKTNRTFVESILFKTNFNINDIQSKQNYKGAQQYSRSKLMNVLFTYKLASDYLKNSTVKANCLHPGFVASKFGHNNTGFFKKFLQFGQKLQAISVIEGAKASTFLALSSDAEYLNGKYIDEDCSEKKSSSLSYDTKLQNMLWEESNNLIESTINK